jgi:hypothetical protein
VQVQLAFLGAGDAVEVVDQPARAGRLALEHLQGLRVGGHDLVGDAFQVAVDGGQWVRSSWARSASSWRRRCSEASSASAMVLNAAARLASSSPPAGWGTRAP